MKLVMGELSCNEVHDGGFGKCEPINTCLSTRPIVEVCVCLCERRAELCCCGIGCCATGARLRGGDGSALGLACLSTWSIAERCMFACARERTQRAELVVATLAAVPRGHGRQD